MSPASDKLKAWHTLAEEAARRGGDFLSQARRADAVVASQIGRDVKLDVDTQSEGIIIRTLRERSNFDIVTEESGSIRGGGPYESWRWIVDPLDGSANFLRGIPLSCISVGLYHGDEPVLGVIYDFNRDELFSGVCGVGAWLNGSPIRVTYVTDPKQAILCSGFPVDEDYSQEGIGGLIDLVLQYKKVRCLGSAALSLAYLAAGRVDAYLERGIKVWDVAAGLAIVCGAGGGVVQRVTGKSFTLNVYASNSRLPIPPL